VGINLLASLLFRKPTMCSWQKNRFHGPEMAVHRCMHGGQKGKKQDKIAYTPCILGKFRRAYTPYILGWRKYKLTPRS
jgi:hypothetical protein